MQIVILCGGQGTRVSSILGNNPKVLAQFNNKSFLELQFDYLSKFSSITNVLLLTGKGAGLVDAEIDKIKSKYPFSISSKSDEAGEVGTASALLSACRAKIISSNFILLFGDSLPQLDLEFIFKHFEKSTEKVGMTYIEPAGLSEVGRICVIDKRVYYWEKLDLSRSDLYIDYGVTYFNFDFIRRYIDSDMVDLKTLLQKITSAYDCVGLKVSEPYIEIGNINSLLNAQEKLGILKQGG